MPFSPSLFSKFLKENVELVRVCQLESNRILLTAFMSFLKHVETIAHLALLSASLALFSAPFASSLAFVASASDLVLNRFDE